MSHHLALNTEFFVPKYWIPLPDFDVSSFVREMNKMRIEVLELKIHKGIFWLRVEYPEDWISIERECSTKVYNPYSKKEFVSIYYEPFPKVLKKYKSDWKELHGLKIGSENHLIRYKPGEYTRLF